MKINNDNQKLLGINDVTSAFMIASEMGRKFESNHTIETIVDEEEVEEETPEENEDEKETSSRPGSGILPETLQEIDSDNSEEKDIKNEEASEADISATEAEENE